MMPPFGGFRVLKPRRTRKRKNRKENMGFRMELPSLPTIDRVVIEPFEHGLVTFPRLFIPAPAIIEEVLEHVYGTRVNPAWCHTGDSGSPAPRIPIDFTGSIISPNIPQSPLPGLFDVQGTTIRPSTYRLVTFDVREHYEDTDIDEREEGVIRFDFPEMPDDQNRYYVAWYSSADDANEDRSRLSSSESPIVLELSLNNHPGEDGLYEGFIRYMAPTLPAEQSERIIFGALLVERREVYGADVSPTLVFPNPPKPPPPTPPPGIVAPPATCGIIPPMTQTDVTGTPIDPSVCFMPTPPTPTTPSPPTNVFGTTVNPAFCLPQPPTPNDTQGTIIPPTKK